MYWTVSHHLLSKTMWLDVEQMGKPKTTTFPKPAFGITESDSTHIQVARFSSRQGRSYISGRATARPNNAHFLLTWHPQNKSGVHWTPLLTKPCI